MPEYICHVKGCGQPALALLANRRPGGHFWVYALGTAPPDAYCGNCLAEQARCFDNGLEALRSRITWLAPEPAGEEARAYYRNAL